MHFAKFLEELRFSAAGAAAAVLCFSAPVQAAESPLVAGGDVGNAPYIIKNPDGTYDGFDVQMLKEIARRLGRPGYQLVDQQWSGIFAGLDARRFEFIMASTVMTEKRAEAMLFTEATHDNDYRFLSLKSGPEIKSLDDLRGKRIAVNQGNVYDQWLTERADEYKWEVARYAKNSDAVQAVLAKRADANLASAGATTWTAVKNPMLKGGLVINSGQTKGLAFRLDDTELRNKVEDAIECMKLDGTIAALQEKWLGVEAGPDSITRNVQAGYGEPGLPGYDPTPHTPDCA